MIGDRAALFDMDGTLLTLDVDIEPVRDALAKLFAPTGFRERFAPILPTIDRAARAASAVDAERDAWRRRGRGLIDEAEVRAAATARAVPGALAGCAALAGAPAGVVTDNGRACVGPALASAGFESSGFSVVVTRDDVVRSKPDPAGLVGAAVALLPRGGRLLWVGDSPRDVAAGRAARPILGALARPIAVDVVAVGGGRGGSPDLLAAGPDELVDDLQAAVARLLAGQTS